MSSSDDDDDMSDLLLPDGDIKLQIKRRKDTLKRNNESEKIIKSQAENALCGLETVDIIINVF